MTDCPYCSEPSIKERVIVHNKFAQAFPTNIPIVPGHVLITPIRCVATFDDLTPEEVEAIFGLITKLKTALTKCFKAEGFNCAGNEGKPAGQSVPHFHLHMLPRQEGDVGITKYEPRKFLYRPGSREQSPQSELLAITELIQKHL